MEMRRQMGPGGSNIEFNFGTRKFIMFGALCKRVFTQALQYAQMDGLQGSSSAGVAILQFYKTSTLAENIRNYRNG